jgi:hypothetical protein
LLILVGVTGVGKSTTMALLARQVPGALLLPDRRDLTDRLLISYMQAVDGQPIEPVRDRRLRFDYTRRYRERFHSGMAHALTQLWIAPTAGARLIFDGLRGENEVTAAASSLPLAHFVVLDAPDLVRVQRLVQRNDAFDQLASTAVSSRIDPSTLDLPADAQSFFSAADLATMADWVSSGSVAGGDLRAKLDIVIEERRNYDPGAAAAALRRVAPQRMLLIDTVTHPASAVVQQVAEWWHTYAPAAQPISDAQP